MQREVLTARDISQFNDSEAAAKMQEGKMYPVSKDGYFDRLFKYIPAEVVTGYIFVLGIVKQLTDPNEIRTFQWLLYLVFCALTPLYLWRVQKVLKLQQHIISLLSFAVWAFTLGGPFEPFSWYNPVYGSVILPVFTLLVAIWEAD